MKNQPISDPIIFNIPERSIRKPRTYYKSNSKLPELREIFAKYRWLRMNLPSKRSQLEFIILKVKQYFYLNDSDNLIEIKCGGVCKCGGIHYRKIKFNMDYMAKIIGIWPYDLRNCFDECGFFIHDGTLYQVFPFKKIFDLV